MTDPQFVVSPYALAEAALERLGRAPDGMHLIRVGTNAVFAAGDIIVRVSPMDYDWELLQQQIDLARWLVDQGFPTAAPISGIQEIDGYPVTNWQLIESARQPTMRDLGCLARDFHEITNDYDGDLPEWDPLGRLGDRLEILRPDTLLTVADCELLQRWKSELVTQARAANFQLQQGPIHGDIHTGNVVVNRDSPYLLDLDRISRGPREWDLADPLAGVVFFSAGEEAWDSFVQEYGYDFREFPGSTELVQLRALFMMSWLLTLQRTPAIETEIQARLEYFRNPNAPFPTWSPI